MSIDMELVMNGIRIIIFVKNYDDVELKKCDGNESVEYCESTLSLST